MRIAHSADRDKLSDAMTAVRGVLAVLLAINAGQSSTSAQTAAQTSAYQKLVQRVKGGDRSVDFKEIRLAYSDFSEMHSVPDTAADKKAMNEALRAHQYEAALKHAEVVLDADYVDMDAHFGEYIADRELKRPEPAAFHKFVLEGLLKSITNSGDGKTPETAYEVIEVHEEYVLLRFMGVGLPESQSLLRKDQHSYDEIKFKDPRSGEETTLYFNVDIPVKHGL
jgi:hypothetical protein